MRHWICALFMLSCVAVQGQASPSPFEKPPLLLPGEGFAVAVQDGDVKSYGEARKEAPMGSLAKLLWLRIEGDEWGTRLVSFKCTGEWNGFHCWLKKGHGRVDLAKATAESCNLAYLAWVTESSQRWKIDYGDGVARLRLEEVFKPFLGDRLKAGDTLPTFGPEWVGDGELLRTTPEAMAKWLADPGQYELRNRCKRILGGTFDGWITKEAAWWFKTGTAPVPGEPGATSAWVAACNGDTAAVLHLPRGHGKAEGIERMQDILGIPRKKKK